MPYLTQERKQALAEGDVLYNPGDLNYLVTKALLVYADSDGAPEERALLEEVIDGYVTRFIESNGINYTTYNAVIGALTCCGTEWERRTWNTSQPRVVTRYILDAWTQKFYRETVAPYEDTKIEENGDVYPCD